MKLNRDSQRVMEWRKRMKKEGWRQLSMLMPSDEVMVNRLLNYRWLLMNEYKKRERIDE